MNTAGRNALLSFFRAYSGIWPIFKYRGKSRFSGLVRNYGSKCQAYRYIATEADQHSRLSGINLFGEET